MSLPETISYLGQLLGTCWQAFTFEIWGIPWYIYLAAIMLLSASVAFLRYVFFNYLGQGVGEMNYSSRHSKSGGDSDNG